MSRRDFMVGLAVGGTAGLLADSLGLHSALSYWGPKAPLVGVLALAFALLWLTRLRPLVAGGAVALGLLWVTVAFTPLTPWMARGLVRRDVLRPADAVVVLASDLQDDGELTPTSMSRLLHALELVSQERAPRLVLTEIAPPVPSYAAPARQLLQALRLHTELVVTGPVYNTRDEAVLVKRLFAERGLTTLVLVTSPTHTRRAAATFEKQGLTVLSSPSVETRFDLETLDTADDRLVGFSSVLHERLGLLLYKWRGDLN